MGKFIIFFLGFITLAFAKPVIELKSPWVRAVPPTSKNTALFLTIENKGDEEDILLSVKTDIAKMVMIHETVNENGIMKMKHVHHLKIPPKSVVKLEPGGLHIMVMGLKKPLKEGDKVRFTLIFKKTGEITITAPVLRK
jgi:copper(I)-binding protein